MVGTKQQHTEAITQLEKEFGVVDCYTVALMDELLDKWTIIVGASWITLDTNRAVALRVIDIFKSIFTPQEIQSMARVGVFNSGEHLIQELRKFTNDTEIRDTKVNGNYFSKAFVVKSRPVDTNDSLMSSPK